MIFVESKNLCFGGGYTKNYLDGFITHIERYSSASGEDLNEIETWLSSQGNLTDIKVDNLIDANYGI